jgi:hypothetical protein
VFGLVPVSDIESSDDGDILAVAAGDVNSLQLASLQHDAAERMATNEELARIRQELEDLSAAQLV